MEYLRQFGGIYENLHLIGISDKPGPVELNIYIDGYFKETMVWGENDNGRNLRVDKIAGIPWGIHVIGIEFWPDHCVPCGDQWSPDTDRNFYLDVLGVNAGPINRALEETSPFFWMNELYLPLIIR